MPGPNDLPPVPNYRLQTPGLSLRRPRLRLGAADGQLKPGWREMRLTLSRDQLERVLSQREACSDYDMVALSTAGGVTISVAPEEICLPESSGPCEHETDLRRKSIPSAAKHRFE